MAAADSGIDPRYAAQFQRGFDPATHTAAPVTGSPVRRSSNWIEGGPPPTAQRVPDPPRIAERPPVTTAPVVESAAEAADDAEDELDVVARPRTEWAVLGAGVALIVVAVGLFWTWASEQADMYGGGYSFDVPSQLRAMALSSLPGPLFVAGIVAIVLWIVLRSVAPRRSR